MSLTASLTFNLTATEAGAGGGGVQEDKVSITADPTLAYGTTDEKVDVLYHDDIEVADEVETLTLTDASLLGRLNAGDADFDGVLRGVCIKSQSIVAGEYCLITVVNGTEQNTVYTLHPSGIFFLWAPIDGNSGATVITLDTSGSEKTLTCDVIILGTSA